MLVCPAQTTTSNSRQRAARAVEGRRSKERRVVRLASLGGKEDCRMMASGERRASAESRQQVAGLDP